MQLDRRTALLGLALAGAARVEAAPPDPTEEMLLWPAGSPGGAKVRVKPRITERSTSPLFHDRIALHTTAPLLTLFRPARPNGAAMLLIPGGGYRWAVVDKEGFELAPVLAAAGVTCFVLRYRLPADGWAAGPDAPLQDAQRALRLIRHRAPDFGVDPRRIGILGASAGGHLAASAMMRYARATYAAVDAADRASARPDFAALLYPVITMADPYAHEGSREQLLGPRPTADRLKAYSLEHAVDGSTPPTFLVHSIDDLSVPIENSLMLLAALRAAKIPAEAHFFEEGGHGFGIRLAQGKPAAGWPQLLLAWMQRRGWMGAGAPG